MRGPKPQPIDSESWWAKAACLGSDTDLFFPVGKIEVTPEAAAVCRTCPVRQPCLDYAMADLDLMGTWAATSQAERRRLRRSRRAS